MYYLDPARGRRRRALVRDRIVHSGRKLQRGVGIAGRDLRHRASGAVATLKSAVQTEQPDDQILSERVRACLGRAISHPAAIEVTARDGVITLAGPVLQNEVPLLIDEVLGVPGIKGMDNRLEIHADADNVPGLQGEARRRPGRRSSFLRENWSPGTRVIGGAVGLIAAVYGFSRRNTLGTILGTASLLLLGRAATNLGFRRWIGVGTDQGIQVEKTVEINAPVEKVFEVWEKLENFPTFMTHVRRVQPLENRGGGLPRWGWTVCGPSGWETEFDSTVTAYRKNRLLAWRTEPGSPIQHTGRVRFIANRDGSTTADVKMIYRPVAGAFGHAIAWLLGNDPKQQMDDDLLRLKTFVETGEKPRDSAQAEEAEKEGKTGIASISGSQEQAVTRH